MSDLVTIARESYWSSRSLTSVEEELLGPLPPPPIFEEGLSAVAERVRQLLGKVIVSNNLDHPHPLVARLLQADEQRRQKQRDSAYPSMWDKPIFESPIEQRRLRILNALFLAVERCGCKPSIRGREGRELYVQVGQQHVQFSLDRVPQRGRTVQRKADVSNREPNKLKLQLQPFNERDRNQPSWEDDSAKKLEKRSQEIAVQLIVAGEIRYREQAKHYYEWRVQRKAELEKEVQRRRAEQERLERERQIKIETERVDRLLAEASALRKANEIPAYVDAAQIANSSLTEAMQLDAFDEWVTWALGQADRIDPIKTGVWRRA
jgi:hypothetical protein